jgi:hypothetical protein
MTLHSVIMPSSLEETFTRSVSSLLDKILLNSGVGHGDNLEHSACTEGKKAVRLRAGFAERIRGHGVVAGRL